MPNLEVLTTLLSKRNYSRSIPIEKLDQLLLFAQAQSYRPCPPWLGKFSFITYNKLPPELARINTAIETYSGVSFNAWFLQKYDKGSYVAPHRDPKNNLHFTYIIPFGSWSGGVSVTEDFRSRWEPGQVYFQRCTINNVQGPRHSVTEITSGTRYAFIGNIIQRT